MAETASGVYDLVYQSPVPLRELSAISVAIELWRLDLKQYLKNEDFEKEFYKNGDREPRITLRDVIANIPSTIDKITTLYLERLVFSTNDWLRHIFYDIFRFHRDNHNQILKNFDDIACDYNGTIHYINTAKRMMLCDRITQEEKFKIACKYSFETDIRRIWPSVQVKVDLDEIDYNKCPHLYYWVCCLENKMDKLPNVGYVSIDELMLKNTPPKNRSSFEYFWNRAELESQYNLAEKWISYHLPFYVRFILPKLSKTQLTKLVTQQGADLIYHFLWPTPNDEEVYGKGVVLLAVWMYVKDVMNEANFVDLIARMLYDETNSTFYITDDSTFSESAYELLKSEYFLMYREIWISAADSLKRSAIKQLLPKKSLFDKKLCWEPREVRLLSTLLLDATLKDRYDFWITNWLNLLYNTRVTDFYTIMKMCFENEDEISEFKKNTMAKYENISEFVSFFFRCGYIKELDDTLKFICSNDEQSRRDLKQQCLQMNFLGENSVSRSNVTIDIVMKSELFHGFIEDAYNYNAELVANFRNQFLAANVNENELLECMRIGCYGRVKQFVQSFESRGHNTEILKKRFVDEFRECLFLDSLQNTNIYNLQEFLPWCLGGEDALIEFKLSIPADEVLCSMLEMKKSMPWERDPTDGLFVYPHCLEGFLFWYFDQSSEKINEFKSEFADIFKMFKPPSENQS